VPRVFAGLQQARDSVKAAVKGWLLVRWYRGDTKKVEKKPFRADDF
jgi:hypothetical protein